MIRSSIPTNVSIREEFAGVKWTDNVRPVSSETEKAVLRAQRSVTHLKSRQTREDRADSPHGKLPRVGKAEVVAMSDRVLRILHCVAMGVADLEITAHEGIRLTSVGHVLRVLGVKKSYLRGLRDKSISNIKRVMVAQTQIAEVY